MKFSSSIVLCLSLVGATAPYASASAASAAKKKKHNLRKLGVYDLTKTTQTHATDEVGHHGPPHDHPVDDHVNEHPHPHPDVDEEVTMDPVNPDLLVHHPIPPEVDPRGPPNEVGHHGPPHGADHDYSLLPPVENEAPPHPDHDYSLLPPVENEATTDGHHGPPHDHPHPGVDPRGPPNPDPHGVDGEVNTRPPPQHPHPEVDPHDTGHEINPVRPEIPQPPHDPQDEEEENVGINLIPEQHPGGGGGAGGHHLPMEDTTTTTTTEDAVHHDLLNPPAGEEDDGSLGYDLEHDEYSIHLQELDDQIVTIGVDIDDAMNVLAHVDEMNDHDKQLFHADVLELIEEITFAEESKSILLSTYPDAHLVHQTNQLDHYRGTVDHIVERITGLNQDGEADGGDEVGPASVTTGTTTATTTATTNVGECGDGVLQPMLGEQCDYGGHEAGTDPIKDHIINGGEFSPCTVDCRWKNNNNDCTGGEVYFDMYLITDNVPENWAELRIDDIPVWNPILDGDDMVIPVVDGDGLSTNYAKTNEAFSYSTCMEPTKCYNFWFLDRSTLDSEGAQAVFDTSTTQTEFAKLVVLLDGELHYSDETYEQSSDGFEWGNCHSH